MAFSEQQLRDMAGAVPFWWHSINLGNGVVTRGGKSSDRLASEVRALRLPDLRGKSVLDVGAWDGFFSFEAERRGAKRVVALDHFIWSFDMHGPCWRPSPTGYPGKCGFETARRALGSRVEDVVGDFMSMDLRRLGTFDVVLYLGVLYHMENPLEAIRRLSAVTREVAVIETEAVVVPGHEHRAMCEFFAADELRADPTNWWAPNECAVHGLCRAAGFRRVETVTGSPPALWRALRSAAGSLRHPYRTAKRLLSAPGSREVYRYRATFHAWK